MPIMQTAIQQLVRDRLAGVGDQRVHSVPLSTRVDPETMEKLQKYAKVLRTSNSMLARRMVEAGLAELEAEIKRVVPKRGNG